MPGYYIKQGNVGIGDASNPDAAALTVQPIRIADVALKIDTCAGGTQTGNLIEANGTGGSAVLTVSVAGVISTSAAQYFIDGTSAAPSITFSADTDTGIYRPTTNQIALATYGSAALVIDGDTAGAQQIHSVAPGTSAAPAFSWYTSATEGIYHYGASQVGVAAAASAIAVFKGGAGVEQVLVQALGTSATPAIAWVGDADTGIYSTAANQVAIAAYGSAVAIFDGDTAAAQYMKMVNGGTSATPAIAVSAADHGLYVDTANYLSVGVAGSAIAKFKGGAAVEQFLVKGLGTSATPSISFIGDPDTGIYSTAANQLAFATYGSAAVIIDGDTAAAQYLLMVNGGTSATPALAISAADTGLYSLTDNYLSVAAAGSAIAHFKGGAAVEQLQMVQVGTALIPSVSFVADSDTGFAAVAANNLSLVAGSSAVAVVAGAVVGSAQMYVMSGGDGVLAPGYSFVDDIDTGICLNAAGKIGVVAAGALISTFSSNGLCAIAGGITVDGGNFVVGTGCSASITDAKGFILAGSGTPATSSENGTAGNIMWDGSNIYVCVASNTWKKVAIAAF